MLKSKISEQRLYMQPVFSNALRQNAHRKHVRCVEQPKYAYLIASIQNYTVTLPSLQTLRLTAPRPVDLSCNKRCFRTNTACCVNSEQLLSISRNTRNIEPPSYFETSIRNLSHAKVYFCIFAPSYMRVANMRSFQYREYLYLLKPYRRMLSHCTKRTITISTMHSFVEQLQPKATPRLS